MKQHKATHQGHVHRMLLFLLLMIMAGVNGVWGEGITTPTYYLNPTTSPGNQGGAWASDDTGRYTVSTANTGGDGDYTLISSVGNGNNGTRVYTNSTNNLVGAGVSFILQFDIKIKGGSDQPSWFQVNDATNAAVSIGKSAYTTVGTSVLQLSQKTANGTEWAINGSETQSVTLATDTWYRFKLLRTYDKTYLTITDRSTDNSSETSTTYTDTEITTQSTTGGLGRMEFATKRYNSSLAIDNLSVQKWGWDVASHTGNLTAANNDNKITSGMPVLYNPDNAAVTYAYDGTVLANLDQTYPPRMKATGTGTVTATIGGKTAQYDLTVTSPTGGGTYDASTSTYTFNFNQEGLISSRSIDDVPFINMSFRGGPTAVVVNDGTRTVLKVIDANGYSHPNLGDGASTIPPENNWGGTFYKFVPSVNGTLTVTGNMNYAKLYESDGTTLKAYLDNGTEIAGISLEAGKTYYLYNAGNTIPEGQTHPNGSNTPLLHSFKFVPESSSLTFRNAQSVITVDVSETSYTNPAISAEGLPVSYSIMSGSSIADVDEEGKVTFKNDYFLNPTPIVVKATAGSNNLTYTINLVKRTWIFNENSKWTTTVSNLTGGGWDTNAGNGYTYTNNGLRNTFYRNTKEISYDQLTTDGSTVMPETAGLLINKTSNNDRFYIAPKNLSDNYLAMRASSISIDDVQAGQTVSVNWTGGTGSAVLDMSDAAGENVTGGRGGTLRLTATQTGRVTIFSNPIVSYINSITVSTPTRAIGTLTYAKNVLNTGGSALNRTGYTITSEDGAVNLTEAYSGPGNFKSSNTSVATVDGSGNITPVGVGTAIITATATAKNSGTHQATVTLVATIEVVADAGTRIRTISISDLLYDRGTNGVNASNGLDRRIPGFDITYTGGDSAKVNDPSILILRNSGSHGKLTITPRLSGSETVTITQALVTVKSITTTPTWKINGGDATAVTTGGVSLTSLTGSSLSIEHADGGNIEITGIKLYYTCSDASKADVCLDETKVGPTIKFDHGHMMRIPNDGKAFTQTPTQVVTDWFDSFLLSYTYASSATNIATINTDGTNGQLLKPGESTITATFHETKYFAGTSASYTIDNVLLKDETYDNVSINNGQRIHIEASAYANDKALTLTGATGTTPNKTTLTYGTSRRRNNTYATVTSDPGSLTLKNENDVPIVVYSLQVVTSSLRTWLYYPGQEDNYHEQVLFTGFGSGKVAGFHVVDVGNPENPIDLTDSYELSGAYSVGSADVLTGLDSSTGAVTAASSAGSSTIEHNLVKKSGMADGYEDNITITTPVQVLKFDDNNPVEWNFMSINDNDDILGTGWTHVSGYHYGYFSQYTPILKSEDAAVIGAGESGVTTHMHGILLKDEFRWYTSRGLRANLSQPKSSFKFPVKAGMEIDIYAATSSADVSNVISNVTDINGNETSELYIQQGGEENPVHNYFLAKEDGMVEVKASDKVGMYLHSITLRVPEIHFTDEIVTVLPTGDNLTGKVTNPTTNIPDESLKFLSYSLSSETDFGGDPITTVNLAAAIDNKENSPTKGQITLTDPATEGWKEGWFKVTVTNTNTSLGALEPKTGSYKVYVVDFRFDTDRSTEGNQQTATLNLNNHDGEDYFGGEDSGGSPSPIAQYPIGKDYVLTPINYTYEIASGNSARAMLKQKTKSVPGQTTYQLTAYSPGNITLKATTGRITATCDLTVEGNAFQYVAPVLSDKDIQTAGGVFTNALPSSFTSSGNNTLVVQVSGDITAGGLTSIIEDGKVKLGGLGSVGHGAIRCIVTNDSGTDSDTSDDISVQFVLTIAYPASSNKKWDFYRMRNGAGDSDGFRAQSNHDNKIGSYSTASVSDYVITGYNTWTTTTNWTRIYRNEPKEPRWALDRSMRCNNAFVIEETAGLLIETPTNSFYVGNNSDAAYTHIGIHSRSRITIPKLKNGDLVSMNLSRVIPNNGAIIEAENVTDLTGKTVNEQFTITRSQTDYTTRDNNGARIIPGYYTFIAHKDGASETEEFDVSFTLADEGYLDVLSIEIYSPKGRNSGNGYDPENGYDYTMLPVKLSATGYPNPPATLLKEEGQQIVYDLTYCHPLWSTSVGPAEYVTREVTDNLNATFENVGWYSAGGAFYNNGQITVNDGYGRIKVRMNNYTAEGKYLIGYTPDYSLTVGHPPHQDYPYTWNFENISGGAVKGKGNNAFNNISSDPYTWTSLSYETYQLDTRTSGGSLYVPGATLVTADRDLGQKGTIAELNAANLGCDEFNGLGFTGQIAFRTALQASAEPAAPAALTGNGKLLEYKMTEEFGAYTKVDKTITWAAADAPTSATTKTYWQAGDGLIMFGSAGKRQASTIATGGAVYLMDGGVTKYLLIKPERALKEGDVITLKGYTPTNVIVQNSGFSFYAAQLDNAYDDLLTLNWDTSDNTQEHTITHTVQQGDGLAGRDSVYIFRAGKQYSVYLTEISITTTDETTPTIAERALTCNGDVTVTIPDLVANHYVYIKSSAAPKTIPSNLTAAVAADGLDAIEDEEVGGIHKHVYKYKVLASGNADVTFASGTKVYRIGVTDIMKKMKRVGEGDVWATESRNHDIDYTQTGHFTVNDIKANTVTAKSYTGNKVTVKLNEKTDAMPAETGMVLKLPYAAADFGKTKNYNITNVTGEVPLFYPPYSQNIVSYDLVKFGGTEGNLMMANLDTRLLTQERETGVIDKDGDDVDDYGDAEGDYTRFIFADRYMKWTKIDNSVQNTGFTDSGNAPVFYRLHLYTTAQDGKTATELNTLDANKAYMLIRSGNVPDALWKGQGTPAKRYIGIEGISDIYEFTDDSEDTEHSKHQGIYNMQGQKIDEGSTLPAGIYIINGRKVIVK